MKSLEGKTFEYLETGNVHLMMFSSPKSNAVFSKLLGFLTKEQKKKGIYVAINKDCKAILALIGKEVDEVKLSFLNCVPSTVRRQEKKCACIYISSPYALTELSLAIVTAIKTERYDFLVLDSIEALEIYHEPKVIEKFIHYLNNLLSENHVNSFIIAHNGNLKENKFLSIIAQLCDNVVEI